jgi:hypothetical protein
VKAGNSRLHRNSTLTLASRAPTKQHASIAARR